MKITIPAKEDKDSSIPFNYPHDSIYGYLDAVIDSSSAKTLAQPTLLVQEGQEAEVETGTSVITSVSTTDTPNGSTQFEYKRENAGLNLKVKVDRIDDNGFVSLSVNPRISVPISAGQNNGVEILIFLVARCHQVLYVFVIVRLSFLQVLSGARYSNCQKMASSGRSPNSWSVFPWLWLQSRQE